MAEALRIGEVARRAAIGIDAVRFYERRGLIPEPPRSASGYRQYPEDVVGRLRFVCRAKELGFTLNEIKDLLSLRLEPDVTCADVRGRAEAKAADIDFKIRSLQRMKKALAKLMRACQGRGPIEECPILKALGSDPTGH